jgi:YD repeat-containing protein
MKNRILYFLLVFAFAACKKAEVVIPIPITPTPILSDAKELSAFSFTKAANPNLVADVTATIDAAAHTISAIFPAGTAIAALKASFVISANANLKVAATTQTSAATANDFTNPITFIVTAQNGTTQNYTVTLIVQAATSSSSNIVMKREEYAPGPPIQTVPINTIDYTYDANNLLISCKDNFGTYKFDYDANGGLKTQTVYDNAGNLTNTLTYSVNANKLPTIITGTYGQTVENYTYGTNGQLTKYTKSYFGVIKDTYEYTTDGKNRIKTAKYTGTQNATGVYTLYNYEYFDDVFDPNPLIKVAITPGITGGLDPTTGKAYALKGNNYQKYNSDGSATGANMVYAYTYATNSNAFITNLSDGSGGSLFKYTYK